MIKDWDYFKQTQSIPYSMWISCEAKEYKVVPLVNPCSMHAVDGFDCFIGLQCGCEEFKLVRRTSDEKEQIEALQKRVTEELALRRANDIINSRCTVGANDSRNLTAHVDSQDSNGWFGPGKITIATGRDNE